MNTVKTRTTHIIEINGGEYQLAARPASEAIVKQAGNGWVVGYLVRDEFAENPLEAFDGMGRMYSRTRDADRKEHEAMQDALGVDRYWEPIEGAKPNPDLVWLDLYEHSGQVWSIHGKGCSCQWDTSTGAGVWIPDESLLGCYDESRERRAQTLEFCRQGLAEYNAWLSGDVWTWFVETFEGKGKAIDMDSMGGLYGSDYAETALNDEVNARAARIGEALTV